MAERFDLTELRTNPDYVLPAVCCRLERDEKIPFGTGYIELTAAGNFKFVCGDKIFGFTVENSDHDKFIRDFFRRGFVNCVRVLQMQSGDPLNFFVRVNFFASINNLGTIQILCTDKLLSRLVQKKLLPAKADIDAELERMPEEFYLPNVFGTDSKLFAYVQISEHSSLENDSAGIFDRPPLKTLDLFGKNFVMTIGLYEDPERGEIIAAAHKLTFNRKNFPCMQLAYGKLSFTLEKKYSSALVTKLLHNENSYVNLWSQYAAKEGEFLLKKLRRIGLIAFEEQVYVASENDNNFFVLTVKPKSLESLDLMQKGDLLMTSDEMPILLANPEMTWQQYQEYVFNQMSKPNPKSDSKAQSAAYEIVSLNKQKRSLTLKPQQKGEQEPRGHLFFDDRSERVQIFRRQFARERIENGTSANPYLGLIIGGGKDAHSQLGGFFHAKKSKRDVPALTEAVRKKIFPKHDPTDNQKQAIKIALNTPDIAIIQGPPGTGKTTVITAILERLNELADKKELQRGQVLITSLQHDAVTNVIRRVTINSLRPIKFGKRRDDEKDLEETVAEWCDDLAKKIRAKNPQLNENARLVELEQTFNFYAVNPSDDNAATFLSQAHALVTDKDLLDEIESLQTRFESVPEKNPRDELETLIRRLRTTRTSFVDGGADIADRLLLRLENKLNPQLPENKKILDALKSATDCFDKEPSKELLRELWECKNILLKRCISPPVYREPSQDPELVALYTKIKTFLARPTDSVDNVLYNLLAELEHNPELIRDTLKDYAFAFAATAQYSASRELTEAKGAQPEYDTVIVDEAARVNPGDLMIPLSQAKTRIIMVGDHRQLPHMYDEEIFEQLNGEGTKINPPDIKITMFQHLLDRAQKLKQTDNIDRFITLNAQYRMHPDLGNFVSKNFYEPHREQFSSPLGAENFRQDFEPHPMLWINLPGNRGQMTRIGSSPCRRCEAEVIVDRIKKYREQSADKNLSMGVISFYRAQVEEINRRLKACDLADEVRVGTVDSYQGMEFDVIFLSIVRTGINLKDVTLSELEGDKISADKKEAVGRSNYGFLTSENRLCVALSRQKRLLVVVGDADLFRGEVGGRLSKIFVPALKNFYELCSARGAVENA